jgi:hypothetical protein
MELGRGVGRSFDLPERFVENFGDIEETDNVAVLVADGLAADAKESADVSLDEMLQTHQMSESLLHHELEGLRRTGGIPSDHRVLGHDLRDGCCAWIEARRGDLDV